MSEDEKQEIMPDSLLSQLKVSGKNLLAMIKSERFSSSSQRKKKTLIQDLVTQHETLLQYVDELSLQAPIVKDTTELEQKLKDLEVAQSENRKLTETVKQLQSKLDSLDAIHINQTALIERLKNDNLQLQADSQQAMMGILSLQDTHADLQESEQLSVAVLLDLQDRYAELQADYQYAAKQIFGLQDRYVDRVNQYHLATRKVGALAVVKNNLTYRLGEVLVKNSQNREYHNIPPQLLSVMYKFVVEKVIDELNEVEQISEYDDAQKAELAKNHLSYRLGKTLVSSAFSLKDLKNLPKDMLEDFQTFKQRKKLN